MSLLVQGSNSQGLQSQNRGPPRRQDHGPSPRSAMERDGDRSSRAARSGPNTAPSKGLRAVFAPLVDYGDDSDEEPDSPGQPLASSCRLDVLTGIFDDCCCTIAPIGHSFSILQNHQGSIRTNQLQNRVPCAPTSMCSLNYALHGVSVLMHTAKLHLRPVKNVSLTVCTH